MALSKVTVTNIGTCRIAEPLSFAKRSKSIKRAIDNIYGFVHTTKEALQQIDFIDGEPLPKELAPYICAKGSFPEWKKEKPSDIYFVEISSTKEIHFDGFLLQINYLDTAFSERPELMRIFFRLYRETDKQKRAAELAGIPAFAQVTPLERRILLEGHVHQTTYEELRHDMSEITRRLRGEVIFVSHINVVGNDGAPIPSRAKLCGWIQQAAEEDQHVLLDPTPLVVAFGRQAALENNGQDVNHYTAAFKEHYGKTLVRTFCETKHRSRPVRRVATINENIPIGGAMPLEVAPVVAPVAELLPGQLPTKAAISAMVGKISAALKAGTLQEATALAERLMGIEDQTYKSIFAIAKVMLKTKRLEEAAAWLQRAVPMAQDPTVPMYELIKCYQKLGRLNQVVETIDQIMQLEGESAELLIIKRDAFLKLGNYPAVAAVALDLVARNAGAAYAVVPSLASHGQFEGSASVLAACRKAKFSGENESDLCAKVIKGLGRAAKLSMEAGDVLKAVSAWRSILSLEPGHEHAISRISRLVSTECAQAKELLQVPDMEGAMAAFRNAVDYNPNEVRALRGLARCYDHLQVFAESADVWERLGELDFEREFSFRRAARFAARAGDVTKALIICGKMEQAEVDDDMRTVIGSLVRKAVKAMRQAFNGGDVLEGCKNAKAILNVEPIHPEALQLLRSTHVDVARQSVAELPSAGRLFARRMVSEIHVILREAESRALKWNIVPEATSQAA